MTTEEQEANSQQYRRQRYSEAVAHYQRRVTSWHQQRLALAEEFAIVAKEHGTDLGFGLPLKLADVIVGAQPSAPNPVEYGVES